VVDFATSFFANFPQYLPVKKFEIGQYLAKIWTKGCGLLFWATLYIAFIGDHHMKTVADIVSRSVIEATWQQLAFTL